MSDATYADAVYDAQALEKYGADGSPLVLNRADNPDWRLGREVPRDGMLVDEDFQVAADFALHVMATYGLRTDPETVRTFKDHVVEEHDKGIALGKELGFVRDNGTRDMAALRVMIERAYTAAKKDIPLTEGGQTATGGDVLENSGDEALAEYAECLGAGKLLSTYVEPAEIATTAPLTSSPNVLVATGRVSWAKPNLTNPPREGGFRECHVPRRGWLYALVDYDAAEMVALAQVLLWLGFSSAMADAINSGKCLHVLFATNLLGISYEEGVARRKAKDPAFLQARQDAKAANFGFPGGMGTATYCELQAKAGSPISEERAKYLKGAYIETWGMGDYFNHISRMSAGGKFTAHQFVSQRQRGGVGYCDGCNTFFQGLVADAAKRSAFALSRAAYTGFYEPPRLVAASAFFDLANPHAPPRDALGASFQGARPVLFIHDEIIAEVPRERAALAAEAQAEIMRLEFQALVPDVRVGAGPALADRWRKGVGTVYDDKGVLQPWTPDE